VDITILKTNVIVDQGSMQTTCQVCEKEAPIYKCPKCGAQTCSLPCTKGHRQTSGM